MELLSGLSASTAAALCKSVTDISTKSASKVLDVPFMFTVQWTVPAVLLTSICLTTHSSSLFHPITAIRSIGADFWLLLVLNGALNVVSGLCYIRAFHHSDASLVAPIMLLTPMLLLGTSWLILGERIPAAGVIGVLLAVAGSYELARSVDHGALTAAYSRLFTDRGVQYMTATAVIWSITSNLDKMGVSASSPIVWSASTCSVMSISGIFLLVITRRNATPAQAWKSILPGVSNTGMMAFQMWAITVYPVPYVIAIKRLSTLFTVLAAKLFFGERIAERILGTLITLMGVLIIAWQFSAEH